MSDAEIAAERVRPKSLVMWSKGGMGKIKIGYAPFDYVNTQARIVIVGITPGPNQIGPALLRARDMLRRGCALEGVAKAVKGHASFAGPMRTNLIRLLNFIGVPSLLGIDDAGSLWTENGHLVHFTSCLRYPVFSDDEPYNGKPPILDTPILQTYAERYLSAEMRALDKAIWIVVGMPQIDAVKLVARNSGVPPEHVVSELYHPSAPNNTGRIREFCDPTFRLSSTLATRRDTILLKMELLTKARLPVAGWTASSSPAMEPAPPRLSAGQLHSTPGHVDRS
jgi:hypothetical protein